MNRPALYRTLHSTLLALLLGTAFAARADFVPPKLHALFPAGGKQGATVEVELKGVDLDEPRALLFSHPGIKAELIVPEPPKPDDKNKQPQQQPKAPPRFRIVIAPDVPVGDVDVRFSGKHGVSNPRCFSIGDLDEAQEAEPNNEREKATRITAPSVVNGRIGAAEDVDWFVFTAKKGERMLVEVRGWRIDSRLDAALWLYDANGRQLAMSQDEVLRDEKRDPLIDFDVPADGDYFVKLTDFTYNGSGDYFYRLTAGAVPLIDYVFPPGVKRGATESVTVYGRNLPGGEPAGVEINGRPLQKLAQQASAPAEGDPSLALSSSELARPWTTSIDAQDLRVKGAAGTSNARLVRYSNLSATLETEPNNTQKEAQRIAFPVRVAGQFLRDDIDCFVFSAKKDEKLTVVVYASRLGYPADPDLEILKPDGSVLVAQQDWNENIGQIRFTSGTRDIAHTFTVPADGDYTLRFEHLLRQNQGGPQFVYEFELLKDAPPDFRLVATPPDEIRVDSHVLHRGGRDRIDVLVWRLNGHNEPITVEARNLPAGVTAEPIVIGKDVKWGTLVLTAAPDAPLAEGTFELVGTSEAGGQKLVRSARFGGIIWDTVNTPALARANRSAWVSVREQAPFALTLSPPQVTVKKGESFDVTVSLTRAATMTNAVQVNGAGYQLPPNFTIPVKTIEANQNEIKLTLKADKIPESTYSFMVNGDGQVPVAKDKNQRMVFPSNTITVTVLPAEQKTAEKK